MIRSERGSKESGETTITLISAIVLTAIFTATAIGSEPASAAPPRPTVGAIRWDAWHGNKSPVGIAVETSLGPKAWHYRVPFFGKVVSDNQVEVRGYTQEIVDQEIAYARQAGLDYWAFGLYDERLDIMVEARTLYLSSGHKNEINFCLWSGADGIAHDSLLRRIVTLMREPTYQKVLGARPLMYVGFIDGQWPEILKKAEATAKLRQMARQAGLENPYLVLMDFRAARGKQLADLLGFDAISSYAGAGGGCGAPYAELAKHREKFWDECKATGMQVVPNVMFGSDRRPRVEHPVPWEKYQKPGVGIERYYVQPTPTELAEHVRRALAWIEDNPSAAPARTALAYAWNENDEGGWLVPTLSEGAARVEALGKVLKKADQPRDR